VTAKEELKDILCFVSAKLSLYLLVVVYKFKGC